MQNIQNDNIYADLLVTNTVQTDVNNRVPVKFYLNQSQPILKDTTNYKMSVVRFSLNTETLPIWIPQFSDIETDTTIYSCTMELNGNYYQRYMQYVPQNNNPIDADERYYVYSYQYVMYLFNNMLTECLVGLNNIAPTGVSVAPKMRFDINTQLCSVEINATQYGFNETGKINIYFNTSFYALLSTLPANIINGSNGMDFQLNNSMCDDNTLLTQEYPTIELWNPISSIVFTTNLLPIYNSVTAPIQVYEDGQLLNNNTNYHFLNILTDFVGNELNFTPYVEYVPSIYRYIDLKPGSSIRNIDINVYWMNRFNGTLKPLFLVPGGSCAMKLFMTKK
jgi:hypothetical protein